MTPPPGRVQTPVKLFRQLWPGTQGAEGRARPAPLESIPDLMRSGIDGANLIGVGPRAGGTNTARSVRYGISHTNWPKCQGISNISLLNAVRTSERVSPTRTMSSTRR